MLLPYVDEGSRRPKRQQVKMIHRLTVAFVRAIFGAVALIGLSAATPAIAGNTGHKTNLPKPLSATDSALYREIFDLQKRGAWGEAKKRFKRLGDKSLNSHVLYQRYMHPTKYRARYPELKRWLITFSSHPGAKRIYRLAQKRRPKITEKVPHPKLPKISGVVSEETVVAGTNSTQPSYREKQSWRARTLARQIDRLVARHRPKRAHRLITNEKNRKLLGPHGLARAEAAVARGFYYIKKDQRALDLASTAAKRAPQGFGDAHWWAGLASWRLNKHEEAAGFFAALADDKKQSAALQTAAGFWAARAYLQSAQPKKVNHYLTIAAQNPRTFYGLLATQLLGYSPKFNWLIPLLKPEDDKKMLDSPRIRRALALIQVGERVRAEAEMEYVPLRGNEQENRILINIAVYGALPRLSYRLGHSVYKADGKPIDAALYPVPAWRPKNGFKIDRALIFALIRQESRFQSRARSQMGATGLMQLMPRTARSVASRKDWNGRRSSLFDPVLNITLGQKYIRHLLDHAVVEGDLFYTIAAYNGGPGNLYKWRKKIDYGTDSLLFIESIPAGETRIFIEQVLTNFWIYRHRLNQPTHSLATLAAGSWPTYIALDPGSEELANSGK